ncbi:MAG TPA: ArsR family transcriptional regulator [Candidatus Marinimicrobia bacterium]|nr:ArsR family transcriptional regulator [Candidatus Neomarinimicrobiota bacterium]
MRQLTKVFKALADSNRLRILKMLEVRQLCVCEIREVLGLATSTVSKHLSILREAGFVTDHKEGKWVNYELLNTQYNEYIRQLMPLLHNWLIENRTIQADRTKVTTVCRETICRH